MTTMQDATELPPFVSEHGDSRWGTTVESAVREDPPTFEELYHAHRLRLVRLAVLLVDQQPVAEDIVQDAFAGLYRRWWRLHDPNKALKYLQVSVVNGAHSTLRRRRTARAYVPPHEPPGDSAEEELVLAEEHRAVLAAVRRLPERQRQVLVLRYWSDLPEAQIAEVLGMSRGTVKSSASRGLDNVRRILEGSRE